MIILTEKEKLMFREVNWSKIKGFSQFFLTELEESHLRCRFNVHLICIVFQTTDLTSHRNYRWYTVINYAWPYQNL